MKFYTSTLLALLLLTQTAIAGTICNQPWPDHIDEPIGHVIYSEARDQPYNPSGWTHSGGNKNSDTITICDRDFLDVSGVTFTLFDSLDDENLGIELLTEKHIVDESESFYVLRAERDQPQWAATLVDFGRSNGERWRKVLNGQVQTVPEPAGLSAEITTLDEAQRTFLDWLGDFDAVDDEQALCEILADCGDELPPDVCESLELPVGSSFGDAAAMFAAKWESG